MYSLSRTRQAQTTIPCPSCSACLLAKRSCHTVYVLCTECHRQYTIQDVLHLMDVALEEFISSIDCDRT